MNMVLPRCRVHTKHVRVLSAIGFTGPEVDQQQEQPWHEGVSLNLVQQHCGL